MSADLSFASFFEAWLINLEALRRQLKSCLSTIEGYNRDMERNEIIAQVLAHHQEFYREKARIAAEDVFLLISPPWLSSFERSLMWVSGFRPSTLIRILESSVANELSPDQRRRIEEIKAETRRKEREIAQDMAKVQETVAEQPVYGRIKMSRELVDGERMELDAAVEEMKAAMVEVIGNADGVQWWSAGEVLAVINPAQGVKLLAAATEFQLRVRKLGIEKDSARIL